MVSFTRGQKCILHTTYCAIHYNVCKIAMLSECLLIMNVICMYYVTSKAILPYNEICKQTLAVPLCGPFFHFLTHAQYWENETAVANGMRSSQTMYLLTSLWLTKIYTHTIRFPHRKTICNAAESWEIKKSFCFLI